jgi:Reverse transcriptase (RNA-dependent DNA polymerase)
MKNYRPISITSLVGKVLERFVRDKTVAFLEASKVIPQNQHGFRARRSCTTLLTGLIDQFSAKLDERSGAHIHAVFLDWSKAFDKVPHTLLLSKLEFYGIKGKLLKWFETFLVGRTQFVHFNGARSEPCEVPSGVIQGSVLGPLLFNVFVADLPDVVKTSLVQYADDCTVFNEITSQADVDALQEDLTNIDIWCANNGMSLNPKKCKAMDITRARTPLRFLQLPANKLYSIGGAYLEFVDKERLLGVHISSDLRWQVHTDIVRKKAAQILGFAARNLQGCTPRVKRVAYLSLVKPIMMYGQPSWHPTSKGNTSNLERIQKRGLHFIFGRHLPPPRQQGIMPISMQLRYTDLNFFKKCLSGATDFDARARIIEGRVLRGDDSRHPRLQQPPARGELGRSSFSYRIVKPWNDLPPPLKDCTAEQFPALCKEYLWQNHPSA